MKAFSLGTWFVDHGNASAGTLHNKKYVIKFTPKKQPLHTMSSTNDNGKRLGYEQRINELLTSEDSPLYYVKADRDANRDVWHTFGINSVQLDMLLSFQHAMVFYNKRGLGKERLLRFYRYTSAKYKYVVTQFWWFINNGYMAKDETVKRDLYYLTDKGLMILEYYSSRLAANIDVFEERAAEYKNGKTLARFPI